MKISELAKVSYGVSKNVYPFTFQQVTESLQPKSACDCKICGEPLKAGEIKYVELFVSMGKSAKFDCATKVNNFLKVLVDEYNWSPKTDIALNDIGPEGELVQEFRGEIHHLF